MESRGILPLPDRIPPLVEKRIRNPDIAECESKRWYVQLYGVILVLEDIQTNNKASICSSCFKLEPIKPPHLYLLFWNIQKHIYLLLFCLGIVQLLYKAEAFKSLWLWRSSIVKYETFLAAMISSRNDLVTPFVRPRVTKEFFFQGKVSKTFRGGGVPQIRSRGSQNSDPP